MMTYARGRSGLRIGFLTIAGALSFATLFFYSTNRALGAVRSTIFIRLDAADGLQRGDAVLHRGVNVGEVKAIDFAGDDVVVRVRLVRVVPVNCNAHAAMVAADLFGRQSIVIRESDTVGPPLAEGDTLRGSGPTSVTARIEELGSQVGELLSDPTIEQVQRTLQGAGSAASSAATAATRVGELALNANELIGEQRLALGDLTREAGQLAHNLREAASPQDLSVIRSRLESSATSLSSATAGMDSAAASLKRILAGLESGEGSVGRLLTDAALYERVTGSIEALERLLTDVRQNPKRYVTIKVF
jgi:phospholipid/cholesterol/gamma-HCH transport system substrate-binding protein